MITLFNEETGPEPKITGSGTETLTKIKHDNSQLHIKVYYVKNISHLN